MLKQGISPVLSKEFNKPNWMKGGKKKKKQTKNCRNYMEF